MSSMSLKSHSNARNFFFDGFKNELRHLCPLNRTQIVKKKSSHYLEHELRHLCPLNLIQTPEKIGGLKNELRHLCPLNRIQIFKKIIAIP